MSPSALQSRTQRWGNFFTGTKSVATFATTQSSTVLHSSLAEPETDTELSTSSLQKRAMMDAFVKKMDGKRTIQRVLVANNGMAATKAIMSMRQWAYINLGDERAIEFVAMATRDDLNANAEFIRLADQYVEVPSGSNKVRPPPSPLPRALLL